MTGLFRTPFKMTHLWPVGIPGSSFVKKEKKCMTQDTDYT